jgi:NTE family protein
MNQMPIKRPKIGIALGSGVARGLAHIGVLRVLNDAGIQPDIVSGTSIGALVGGCHVAHQLAPLEEFVRSLTRRRLLGIVDFRFRASGLVGDSKLEAILYKYFGGLQLEDMDRTFVAVATELSTGHEVWLREGSLVQAIRASYALPGVLAPVAIDNRWLIDGAVVNPVPVSVVRALGARLVIAVNLNADPFDPTARHHRTDSERSFYLPDAPHNRVEPEVEEEIAALIEKGSISAARADEADENSIFMDGVKSTLKKIRGVHRMPEREIVKRAIGTKHRGPGFASVLLASLNIVQDRLARARLASDPPDIVIAPKVGHLTLMEFDRADELIKRGEEAAEEALPAIRDSVARLTR